MSRPYRFAEYTIERIRLPGRPDSDVIRWTGPNGTHEIDMTRTTPPWTTTLDHDGRVVMAVSPERTIDPFLVVSLRGAPSLKAFLVHDEDDRPRGYYYATDLGNDLDFIPDWAEDDWAFILRSDSTGDAPIDLNSRFRVMVVDDTPFAEATVCRAEDCGPQLIVPAYFGTDAALWGRLADAASRIGDRLIVIANPNNGPDDPGRLDAFNAVIDSVVGNGGIVLGYVYTCWVDRDEGPCPRSHLAIDVDIDKWYNEYPSIQGIFFDQVSTEAHHVDFYRNLYSNVQLAASGRHPPQHGMVVFNPGVLNEATHVDYLGIGDAMFVVYEGMPDPFFDLNPARPVRVSQRQRAAALVYGTAPGSDVSDVLAHARSLNLGGIYVTDDKLPNPWDTLASYFEEVVHAIERVKVYAV